MTDEIKYHFQQLQKAVNRLQEGVDLGTSQDIFRDGTIQRFEFTFELAWKLMQKINREHGFQTVSPRDSIRQCFQLGFLAEDVQWLQMIENRNLTSHTYAESMANQIYEDTKKFVPLFFDFSKKVEDYLEK